MQKHSKILNLTGNLVILAPPIAMTFTRVILRVQTETVLFVCATVDPVTFINTLVTIYYVLAGILDTSQSTEANAQVTVNNTFKFSQLDCLT